MPSRAILLSVTLTFSLICHAAISLSTGPENQSETHTANAIVVPQVAPILINEFMADPDVTAGDANGDGTPNATQDEFVEIVNAGGSPVSIDGFTISDSTSIRFTFPSGKTIPAGEAAVVFGGGAPTGSFGNASANGLVFAIGGVGLSLANGGDSIVLKDNAGAVVASLTFGSAEGSANQSITRSPDVGGGFVPHSTAPGSGGTLFSPGARVNGRGFVSPDPVIAFISPDSVVAGGDPVTITIHGEKFQDGAEVRIDSMAITATFVSQSQLAADVPSSITGSAGVHLVLVENPDGLISNTVNFTVLGLIGINEFLADPPDGAAGDANGDGTRDSSQDEFIEVINRAGEAMNVGGFSLSDASQIRFSFPFNTMIPANESAVVFGGGMPQGEFGNAGINGLVFVANLSLGNTGDSVILKDASGAAVEVIAFGVAEGSANQSLNRNPDVTGTGFTTHSTIPGSGGRLFSPGAKVDGTPFTPGPRITRIEPDRIERASSPVNISIFGSGFDPGAVVLIDSSPADSTVRGTDEIVAVVPAAVAGVIGEHSIIVRGSGGNHSNTVILTVTPGQPTLTFVIPKFVDVGSPDFTISVLGSNFEAASVVLVDDSPIATAFHDSGELRATVPAALASTLGVRRVKVRNSDGRVSNELAFTVVPPRPLITALTPNQAQVGSAPVSLQVEGLRFTRGSTVFFDLRPLDTVFISTSELNAMVPDDLLSTPGFRAVTAHNDDGAVSDEVTFRVSPIPPVVSKIEPDSAIEGEGDLKVTIFGERFQTGALVRAFEGIRVGPSLPTSFISSERLEAAVPASLTAKPGAILLRVENPDSGVSNSVTLNVSIKDALVINEFLADPPAESVGDANGDGTRSTSQDEFVELVNRTSGPLDLSGYILADSEAPRHLFAPGTIVPPFEAVVVFGGGAPNGTFGNAAENKLVFTASSGTLSLGNNGDVIKLRNASGDNVQEVTYGPAEGNANQSVNREPDADGARFLPHTRVAPGSLLLFSPGARAGGAPFTIKPSIHAVSPPSIRVGSPGFNLVVTGARFLAGAAVFFGGIEIDAIRRSDTEIWAQVTADLVAEGGTADVQVRNPKGELSAPTRFLIADDPPRISSVSPNHTGTGAENLEVVITGERLQRGARVTVSGEGIDARHHSHNSISVTLPAKFFLHADELDIHVLNADGNLSNGVKLTVENGPLITRLTRAKIKAGHGDVELDLGGLEFKDGVELLVSGSPVDTVFVSSSSIKARIPGTMTERPGTLEIQARNPDGGRSNRVSIRVVN